MVTAPASTWVSGTAAPQRRNQKIVEEAPGPSVTPDVRDRMGEAALRVAAAVGYASAGTVEMLLTDAGEFFFLEMNTRLQVEHPVTEAVTGRDLVADQLRIAGGSSLAELGLSTAPRIRGHAIEARLYAEDPESGFLPATGRLLRLRWPEGIRIDAGVREGDLVGDRYDPMLAKLIATGPSRSAALAALRSALDATDGPRGADEPALPALADPAACDAGRRGADRHDRRPRAARRCRSRTRRIGARPPTCSRIHDRAPGRVAGG